MLLDLNAFETKSSVGTTLPPRRLGTAERLLRSVRDIAGPLAEVVSHAEAPWASITFSGARHTLVLRFAGSDAVSDGEGFVTSLPEHEFRVRGQLVADATITRVDHELLPAPLMEVECEILLLSED
ncbi:MAG: hypothetical protein B7X90_07735 [Novosphingobium sp. 17-62-19]|uniref:hypothetical protein n=1 Tax=Novosphingobium sp. 17-62-19 TaxID=1970406 RepID=UPI000BD73CC5|nr:hypothetical protein [Novosphingobium sp. 17-62-19]OZA19739.1 MAG: hypothetical protein B7X90_07735 [Novosphingobium sp. 17-62-19]HQS95855.1 hypothetical protein [Novosphingobium sp.]